MSIVSLENNPYYQKVLQNFLSVCASIEQMKSDFSPGMIDAYKEAKKKQIQTASELLKLGVEFSERDECISIHVDDDIYDIPRSELEEFMGEEEFRVLFEKQEQEEFQSYTEDTSYNDVKGSPNAGHAGYGYGNGDWSQMGRPPAPVMNPYMMNPLWGLLSCMNMMMSYPGTVHPVYTEPVQKVAAHDPLSSSQSSSFKYSSSEKGSDILKDISNMQKRVILLEQEKDDAKNKASSFKDKYNALKEQFKETEASYQSEKEATQAKLDELLKAKEELEKMSQEQQEQFLKEKQELENGQTSMGENIKTLEQKKSELESKKSELEQKISATMSDLKSKENTMQRLQSEKNELEQKYKTLNLNSEANEKRFNERISQLEKELSSVRESVADKELRNQKELERKQQDSDRQIDNLEKQISASKVQVSNLEKQVAESKEHATKDAKKYEDAQKQINTLKSDKDNLETESKRVKKENEGLKKENDDMKNKISKLQAASNEEKSSYEKLKKEAENLRMLAYFDSKVGTKNANAFNSEFESFNKSGAVLVMTGICGMKNINNSYGRQTGDRLIKTVADEFIKAFSKDDVYRILGDQFVILVRNTNYNNVQSQFASIKAKLANDSINIAYGIAVGNNCGNNGELLSVAENMMKQQKGMNYNSHQEQQNQISPQQPQMQATMPQQQQLQTSVGQPQMQATMQSVGNFQSVSSNYNAGLSTEASEAEEMDVEALIAQSLAQ